MNFEFADYRFDAARGLSRGGEHIHLQPKARRLLQALLQADGRVVSKEALFVAVWGGADASDESLSRVVFQLRLAMPSRDASDLVETLYGAGLRLTVPVRAQAPERAPPAHIAQTPSSQAANALLAAREMAARRSPADLSAAVSSARLAIDADPTFVAAWATLAEIQVWQILRGLRPAREAGPEILDAVRRALALDPACGPALATRGWVRAAIEFKLQAGLTDIDDALAADPDYWGSYLMRAWVLQAGGRQDEAVAMIRRALELNPAGLSLNGALAIYLLLAGRADEALVKAREDSRRFSSVDHAQYVAAIVTSSYGQYEEAIEYGRRALALAPHTPLMHAPLAYALAKAGEVDEARGLLAVLESQPVPLPASAAAIYLALGERSTAVARLVESRHCRQPQFVWSRDDPRFAALHGDPRVEALWAGIVPVRVR